MKTKIIATVTLGAFLWYSSTLNSKYNDISNKLDIIMEIVS